MEKTTFTLAEAAKLLSCHKETLRRSIQAGELRAARLGRGYRISRRDLQTFWTAQGGGELFSEADVRNDPLPESPARDKSKESPARPKGPQQLTLPTE
ncbi:helix-turn-helix domain-containing protein [Desulfovibrio sp. OttesenSCG-928-I05]|nr:helix-turn-helix domain-containing protein [Desulfovibrio sp. OttesenSCG-928-I05]